MEERVKDCQNITKIIKNILHHSIHNDFIIHNIVSVLLFNHMNLFYLKIINN